jgi:hypothetical protein
LQFKQKFPADYFNTYKIACQNGELAIGSVQVYEVCRPLTQAVLTKATILKMSHRDYPTLAVGFNPRKASEVLCRVATIEELS